MSTISELGRFLRARRKMWLLPIIIMMLVFAAVLVLAETTAIAPFIYTLF
jgi:Family of unknown function (DUF5989)